MIMKTLDLDAVAARLYPTKAQDAPAVPPVDATPTTEPAATKTAEPVAAQAVAHTPPVVTPSVVPPAEVPYALTLPDDAVLEASAVERSAAFAKANSLSPDAAQHVLEHANAEVQADRDRHTAQWNTLTRETWVTEAKHDPEIGGEKLPGAVTDAKRFLQEFGDPELRQFLEDTGFGNNKLVVRMLSRAMKRRVSATPVTAGGSGPGAPDTSLEGRAARMYPTTPKA
jgi:hypothetical protein